MATYVDISATKHLTYSPWNKQHNILYNKARNDVNQRYLHKVWFDISPFKEQQVYEQDVPPDYMPDKDSRYMPLESIVVVEDYFEENPQLAKEFKTGEFWEYLFSGKWDHGYSVRVLEGRLQDIITTVLYGLISIGVVSQHGTMAYAKNRRRKSKMFKCRKPGIASMETLLVEFVYFGHTMKVVDQETYDAMYASNKYSTPVRNYDAWSDDEGDDSDQEPLQLTSRHSSSVSSKSSEFSILPARRTKFYRVRQPKEIVEQPLFEESSCDVQENDSSVIRPDVSRTSATRSDISRTSVTRSDVSRTNVTRPDVSRTSATRSDVSRTGVTRPDVSRTSVARPDASGTSVTRPDASRTSVTRSDVSRTSVTRSDVSRTSATRSDVSMTCVTRPDVSRTSASRAAVSKTSVTCQDVISASCPNVSSENRSQASPPNSNSTVTHPNINLTRFACSEKVSFLGTFDLMSESDSDDDGEYHWSEKDNFGQEFYLGDTNVADRDSQAFEKTVRGKLRKRREIVAQEREDRRHLLEQQQLEEQPKTSKMTRSMSALCVRNYLNESEMGMTTLPHVDDISVAKAIADAVTGANAMLTETGKNKSRTRKSEQPTDKVPKGKANTSQTKKGPPPLLNKGVKAGSSTVKEVLMGEGPERVVTDYSPSEYYKQMKDDEKTRLKRQRMRAEYKEIRDLFMNVDPANDYFASIVLGITSSEPCRLHCYKQKDVAFRIMTKKEEEEKPIRRRTLLVPDANLVNQSNRTRRSRKTHQSRTAGRQTTGNKLNHLSMNKQSLKNRGSNRKNKKTGLHNESQDESSSDSDEDCVECHFKNSFDTRKLNVGHSVENIRSILGERERTRVENKSSFFNVLRKYCRIQSVLKAFGKGRNTQDLGQGLSEYLQEVRAAEYLQQKRAAVAPPDGHENDTYVLGKLRWFSFLDKTKSKPKTQFEILDPVCECDSYPMQLFRENLEKALEEFVVRREVVVSDYNSKASVSITFTKKSVFAKARREQ